jgi:hypothetical protein
LPKKFAGHDIVWIACSAFDADEKELKDLGLESGLPPEITAPTDGPTVAGGLRVGGTELDLVALKAEEESTVKLLMQKWMTPLWADQSR